MAGFQSGLRPACWAWVRWMNKIKQRGRANNFFMMDELRGEGRKKVSRKARKENTRKGAALVAPSQSLREMNLSAKLPRSHFSTVNSGFPALPETESD